MELVIGIDDPLADDVCRLLETHLAFARAVTPPGHVHALDVHSLLGPSVTFFSAREGNVLRGVGALRQLDDTHVELKSMHTAEAARRRGVARSIVEHLLAVARERGYRRMSLETGTMDAFAPSRALYARMGFIPCEPFGSHTQNAYSVCMTLPLDPSDAA